MRRLCAAFAAALLLAVSLAAVAPVVAWAEDGPEALPAPKDAKPSPTLGGLSQDELEEQIKRHPGRWLVYLFLRFAPAAAGIALLLLWNGNRLAVRRGDIPPPPHVEPSVPFRPAQAFSLFLGLVLAVYLAAHAARLAWPSLEEEKIGFGIAVTAAIEIPLACIVVLRRWRMPHPPRMGFRAGIGWGGWAYLVAQTAMVPLIVLVPLVLHLLGEKPEVQDLIVQFVRPERAWHPWAIGIFGILVAPVVEEVIFRGLLHPAVRSMAGGGRRGAWVAAVVVSALFAAVHGSWTAALPLFVLAMVLTWVFERTNSLVAPATAHVLNNALTLLPLPALLS